MEIVTSCAGLVLICVVVLEVFNDLFQPTGSGALSEWMGRHVFNAFRRMPRRMLPLSGPLTLVMTILIWMVALAVGFALVFYGSFPEAFRTSVATVPVEPHRFSSALYFSFQVLTTLAFGDLSGATSKVRFAACVEGLLGFGVLTASVSSIVLIYPALSRMRLLARGVSHLLAAERAVGVPIAASGSELFTATLARDVTSTRTDLIHFPVIYYFAAHDPLASLAYAAPHLVRFAHEGQSAALPPDVRLGAAALDDALRDLARFIAEKFLHMDAHDRDAVFRAFAKDHKIASHV